MKLSVTIEETQKLAKYLRSIDLVIGNLNLDFYRSEDENKLKMLCENRSKVLNEVTTTRFNQLDHILLDCKLFPDHFVTSFRNHTTDHYVPVVRIPKFGNKISKTFLERIYFDREHWTKATKRKRNDNGNNDENAYKKRAKSKESCSLKCLLSPNWLTEEILNEYMKLLEKLNSDVVTPNP